MILLRRDQRWLNYAIFYLLLMAIFGAFMRMQMVMPYGGFNYQFLVHTHSHVALLGWAFGAAYLSLIYSFLSEHQIAQKKYQVYFWWTQVTVIGMFFSFPFQGYAFWSITFSTLFLLMTYWFTLSFIKDLRKTKRIGIEIKFIRAGLFYLVFSSLGPWALGPIIALGMSKTELYYNGVYFYLHFLYNGFFIFILIGLLIFQLKRAYSTIEEKVIQSLYKWMHISVLFGFFLSTLWARPNNLFYVLAFIGGLGQLFALYYFILCLMPAFKDKSMYSIAFVRILLKVVVVAFIIKVLLQFASAFPQLAEVIYEMKSTLIVGYLHLVLLGIVTLGFLLNFLVQKWLNPSSKGVKWGISIFVIGWVLSELLLFSQAWSMFFEYGSIPNYFQVLFLVTCIMPIGILILWLSQRFKF